MVTFTAYWTLNKFPAGLGNCHWLSGGFALGVFTKTDRAANPNNWNSVIFAIKDFNRPSLINCIQSETQTLSPSRPHSTFTPVTTHQVNTYFNVRRGSNPGPVALWTSAKCWNSLKPLCLKCLGKNPPVSLVYPRGVSHGQHDH